MSKVVLCLFVVRFSRNCIWDLLVSNKGQSPRTYFEYGKWCNSSLLNFNLESHLPAVSFVGKLFFYTITYQKRNFWLEFNYIFKMLEGRYSKLFYQPCGLRANVLEAHLILGTTYVGRSLTLPQSFPASKQVSVHWWIDRVFNHRRPRDLNFLRHRSLTTRSRRFFKNILTRHWEAQQNDQNTLIIYS